MVEPDQNPPSSDESCPPIRLALRRKEAARALGIGERKLWEMTADGTSEIPHVRLGKAVLYPLDELRRWLAD